MSLAIATTAFAAISSAAPTVRPQIFVGGVAGIEDLLVEKHSAQFRALGGGLYLHNNGWALLKPAQQRALLRMFKDRPVAIELGFGGKPASAESWAHRLKTGYIDAGCSPDFIAANAFAHDSRPTPAEWKAYTEKLRTAGGLPVKALVLPTFEYANFSPNIRALAKTKVSQMPEFQEIVRYAGGIVIDAPCGYFFKREQGYRDWVVDAIRWTQRAGLKAVHIASPNRTGEQFDEEAIRLVNYLKEKNAMPNVFVSENYEAHPPSNYPNRVGDESVPHTTLGVALLLAKQVK
ncbi:MAG: hypothetical protein NTZ16_06230 [Verrucomicrobia bacterium]|nr:hypothetical protein [Verrucomicrobiota bacterium]